MTCHQSWKDHFVSAPPCPFNIAQLDIARLDIAQLNISRLNIAQLDIARLGSAELRRPRPPSKPGDHTDSAWHR
ncbi:MAG: hypothetical protein M3443_20295, partial [Actinomycetota bacterium]|nr:hypothetical protein [Actinomycetota bacterium]